MKIKILFILLILPLVLMTKEMQKNYFSVKKIQELFDDKILKLILVEFEKEEIKRLRNSSSL